MYIYVYETRFQCMFETQTVYKPFQGSQQIYITNLLIDSVRLLPKNMDFHGVKSTAHPPIIGALGHSTDFIVKQPNTAVINIYLVWCNHAVSCWKRSCRLKQQLHLQTIKHTGIRKLKLYPAFFFSCSIRGKPLSTKTDIFSEKFKRGGGSQRPFGSFGRVVQE